MAPVIERELGVAVIHIGLEFTGIAVFERGLLRDTRSLDAQGLVTDVPPVDLFPAPSTIGGAPRGGTMSRIATIGGKQVILAEPYQPRACPAVGRGHEMCIVSEKEKPGE